MGKVVERVKVTNFKDTSKSIEIEAVIDTDATMSVLPMDLIQISLRETSHVRKTLGEIRYDQKGMFEIIIDGQKNKVG